MRTSCPSSRILRALLFVLAIPLVAYVLYFTGIAVVLNTPLFAKLTKMSEEEEHLKFSFAYSLIPGRIRAHEIFLGIREPGVDLDIYLRGPAIELDLTALRRKEVRIHHLTTAGMNVVIRPKKAPVGKKKPEISEAEELERRQKRWKIWITGIDLQGFEAIAIGERKLKGEMRIQGGFFLQPGTVAEIFPTRFTIRDGKWDSDIREIHLDLEAAFARFRGPRVSGSEAFDYLDATATATGVAASLDLFNLTLRSLDGYGFGRSEKANLNAKISVRRGVLQPGSHFRAERSDIRFDSPSFRFSGQGQIGWQVGKLRDESALRLDLKNAKAEIQLSQKQVLRGSIRAIEGRARLRGLQLSDPFSGLAGGIRLTDGAVGIAPQSNADPDAADFALSARLRGEVAAIAGKIDKSWIPRSQSRLTVWIDESRIKIPDLGKIEGNGLIALSLRPIDFRTFEAELPAFRFDYSGTLEGKYPFDLRWSSARSIRRFPKEGGKPGNFEGKGSLYLSQVNQILKFLSSTKKIPKLAAAALSATEMRADIEWDFTEEEKWMRAKEIDSNGIWKGWGAVVFTDRETRGVFEGRVAGIPVGLGIQETETRFKLLPNQNWYDARAPLPPETTTN